MLLPCWTRSLCSLAVLLLLSPLWAGDAPPKGQRVFVAGHSFHVMIPTPLSEIAKSAGIKDHEHVGTQSIGGSRVIQHWMLAEEKNKAKKAIISGKVDVLTLSCHVKLPDEGIDHFVELALKHNDKSRVLVQASWYPFDLPGNSAKNFKNDQRDEIKIEDLRKGYESFYIAILKQARELNEKHKRQVVLVVPVGHAVMTLREKVVEGKVPGISKQSELFTDSIGHARPPVALLNAYCHYAVIYDRSPVGLPTPAALKGQDQLNRILQEIAWETVTSQPLTGVAKKK